jgi:hypothetical protein
MEEQICYNSMDLSSEKKYLYLISGKRIPQNESELHFLEEVEEIIARGDSVIIPHGDVV